jgi:hypothetical protein
MAENNYRFVWMYHVEDALELALDQANVSHLGSARNQKNSKSLVFLRRLML